MTRPQGAVPPQRPAAPVGPMRWMAGGMPPEKSLNFKASTRRLLAMMSPEKPLVVLLVACGVIGVVLSVLAPKLLGTATDIIFTGAIGGQLPAGMSKVAVSPLCALMVKLPPMTNGSPDGRVIPGTFVT